MKDSKTNAMRILDTKKISYELISYEIKDGKVDGVSVAEKIKRNPRTVFKTLVAQGTSKGIFVFMIPVEEELDLKKAAKAVGEKKVEMIPVKDLQKWTGYVRGGCSPIGMKKVYPTIIDQGASCHETIVVSGGRIGLQMELKVSDLQRVTEAQLMDVVKL